MKRILVGVDGSKESRHAASVAAELARATGARLTVASAVSMPVDGLGGPDLLACAAEWREEERARSLSTAQGIASAVATEDLSVETVVALGPPAQTLADLARDREIDMIVVGHRGRGAAMRALTGSVADRLVQISPKPVLVVR